jgi:hypothetical protein
MLITKQKVGLKWIGKDNRHKLEPRILLEELTPAATVSKMETVQIEGGHQISQN